MFLIYNFFIITFYKIIAPCYSVFSTRLKTWLIEQKKIKDFTKNLNNKKKIWFHCASAGEYEQIKPIITYFEKNHTDLIITFFSPDAYNHLKDKIKHPCSLIPFDTKKRINDFIEKINPEKILIAKNEIWPNLINTSYKKSIPIYLIGSKIKSKKVNNIFYGKYYCYLLKKITRIFVQDLESKKILENKKIDSILSGDPRIDQVLLDQLKIQEENQLIKSFIGQRKVILAGSTDFKDYNLFKNSMNSDQNKWIIIPHTNSKKDINQVVKLINRKWSLYSNPNDLKNSKIIIIDKHGILKYIYKYANIVYIGGGFTKGVHNCLEPAIFGKPILFGPKYKNFPEANYFINNEIAFCVKNKKEFEHLILNKTFNHADTKMKTTLFFEKHQGASKKIIKEITC
tara:strand:- start:56 stop:1252 length:1197 start_codon:yes stop_codon:yes gene_type:complete